MSAPSPSAACPTTCGRGMMRRIKSIHPDANIVAIDYDASATRVNQENRLKLMLATARKLQNA